MAEKNGGPAFPHEYTQVMRGAEYRVAESGMTLRDYFAAQALASEVCPANSYEHDKVAAWCYRIADAMLVAREADHA